MYILQHSLFDRLRGTVCVSRGVVDIHSPSISHWQSFSHVTAAVQSSRTDVLLLKTDTEWSHGGCSNTVEWMCKTDNFWCYQTLSFHSKLTHLLHIHKLRYLNIAEDTERDGIAYPPPPMLIHTAPYFNYMPNYTSSLNENLPLQ